MTAEMFPTPYQNLNQVLNELVSRIQQILGNGFIGAYLQGSFAIGDFDQYSDVDFIVVIEDELPSPQVEALQTMHDQVYELDSEWAKHLEGSYFPREILRHLSNAGMQLWYLDHGARSLVRSDHCNTILVRWVVRQKGVTLAGPPPKTLINPITKEKLRSEIFDTINFWGQEILADPNRYNNRFYQSFIVLSYCRMLHDLCRGYPGSKREGAEWATSVLEPSWSSLIDGAWDGRPDPAQKVRQPADPDTFRETLRFVEYIMNESNQYLSRDSCT
jgi:predicted nucleotidyltransferase